MLDYSEFMNVDGREHLDSRQHLTISVEQDDDGLFTLTHLPGGYEICHNCDGNGFMIDKDCNENDCECDCCDGEGMIPDMSLVGLCVKCGEYTVNKSHLEYLCTQCDSSRHMIEKSNYPEYYESKLI